ncbi:unnamed protein product, partial [Polarella glacialis]
ATVIPVSQIPAAHVMHAALAGRSSRGSLGLPIAQGPKVLMAGGAHAGMRSRSPSLGPASGSRVAPPMVIQRHQSVSDLVYRHQAPSGRTSLTTSVPFSRSIPAWPAQ